MLKGTRQISNTWVSCLAASHQNGFKAGGSEIFFISWGMGGVTWLNGRDDVNDPGLGVAELVVIV